MNYRKLTTTALAIVFGFSALAATAQPRDHRDGHDNRGGRHAQQDRRDGPGRVDPRHGPRPGMHPGAHRGPGPHARHMAPDPRGRGVGPQHRYYRGDRLPPGLRTRHYVVDDWRGHRLSAPPRGYRWVQVDADYVLIAAATGLIASIILAH
jgi:Ni/Co efflux regulator RcnB